MFWFHYPKQTHATQQRNIIYVILNYETKLTFSFSKQLASRNCISTLENKIIELKNKITILHSKLDSYKPNINFTWHFVISNYNFFSYLLYYILILWIFYYFVVLFLFFLLLQLIAFPPSYYFLLTIFYFIFVYNIFLHYMRIFQMMIL